MPQHYELLLLLGIKCRQYHKPQHHEPLIWPKHKNIDHIYGLKLNDR